MLQRAFCNNAMIVNKKCLNLSCWFDEEGKQPLTGVNTTTQNSTGHCSLIIYTGAGCTKSAIRLPAGIIVIDAVHTALNGTAGRGMAVPSVQIHFDCEGYAVTKRYA